MITLGSDLPADLEDGWVSVLRSYLLVSVSLQCTGVLIDFGRLSICYRRPDGELLPGTLGAAQPMFDSIKNVSQLDPISKRGRFALAINSAVILCDVVVRGNECEILLHCDTDINDAIAADAAALFHAFRRESADVVMECIEESDVTPVFRYNRSRGARPLWNSAAVGVVVAVVAFILVGLAVLVNWLWN